MEKQKRESASRGKGDISVNGNPGMPEALWDAEQKKIITCRVCEISKPVWDFETNRRICRACRNAKRCKQDADMRTTHRVLQMFAAFAELGEVFKKLELKKSTDLAGGENKTSGRSANTSARKRKASTAGPLSPSKTKR